MQVINATHFQTPDRLCADPEGLVAPFTSHLPVASYISDPDNEEEILGWWEYLRQAIETNLFPLSASTPCLCLVWMKKEYLLCRRLVKKGEG
jgi:hypothetical protein